MKPFHRLLIQRHLGTRNRVSILKGIVRNLNRDLRYRSIDLAYLREHGRAKTEGFAGVRAEFMETYSILEDCYDIAKRMGCLEEVFTHAHPRKKR